MVLRGDVLPFYQKLEIFPVVRINRGGLNHFVSPTRQKVRFINEKKPNDPCGMKGKLKRRQA